MLRGAYGICIADTDSHDCAGVPGPGRPDLQSSDFSVDLATIYRDTRLATA